MSWAGARLAALDGLNGRLALLETAGTATGGLLGGMIAALDGTYVLLIVSVVFLSLTSLAGAVIVFPRDVRWVGAGMREGLRAELAAIAAMAKHPGDVSSCSRSLYRPVSPWWRSKHIGSLISWR